MGVKVGDMVRSILSGKDYKIKKIIENKVVLESQNGKSQVITEVDNLKLLYREKENIKS